MRSFWFFIKVGLIVYAVVWVVDQPGNATLQAFGYEVSAPIGVLILAVILFAIILSGLDNLVRLLRTGAGRIFGTRKEKRLEKGMTALTDGFLSLAEGNGPKARKFARRASRYLEKSPLKFLLSAQAAQMEGRDEEATGYYNEMLLHEKTRDLGLRGLLGQAMRAHDEDKARAILTEAETRHIAAPWVYQSLFSLQSKHQQWEDLLATLDKASKLHVFDKAAANHHRAVIYMLLSQEEDNQKARLKLALKALSYDDMFAPVVHHAALTLAAEKNLRKAKSVLLAAWKKSPHPLLIGAAQIIMASAKPKTRRAFDDKMHTIHPTDFSDDARWVCEKTGIQFVEWRALTPAGHFNTLQWKEDPAVQLQIAPLGENDLKLLA